MPGRRIKPTPGPDGVIRYETARGEKVEQHPLFPEPDHPEPPERLTRSQGWLNRARALGYVQQRATQRWDSLHGVAVRKALMDQMDRGEIPGFVASGNRPVYSLSTLQEWFRHYTTVERGWQWDA